MIEQLTNAFQQLQDKLLGWIDGAVLNLPNFLLAVLTVFLGWMLAKSVYRLVHKLVLRANATHNVADLLGSISRVLVIGLSLFVGLSILGLSGVVASGLAGAGIVGLAIGFALQDPLANLFSGIMMSVKELYKTGDLIESNGYTGVIEGITLRTTILRTFQGQEVAIPNKDVLQSSLINYTRNGVRRVDVPIGVSYGDDLERAARIAKEAVEQNVDRNPDRPVEVFWTGFGASSIDGVLRVWIKGTSQLDYLKAQSAAICAIKAAYDREDIMIPFPIRTIDFGIRGGESLKAMQVAIEKEKNQLSLNGAKH